jgi:uncharacterized membrane protein
MTTGGTSAIAPSLGRIDAIDAVRGVAMALMALDHTRGFFCRDSFLVDPTDLDGGTHPALFLTRWLSHFCPPIFVFLAGTGAYLHLARGKSKAATARFLLERGLVLGVLDVTVVDASWSFGLDYTTGLHGTVLWVIGAALVVLAALLWLPRGSVGVIGVFVVALHNLVASKTAEEVGLPAGLWGLLETGGSVWLLPGVRGLLADPASPTGFRLLLRFTSNSYTLLGWTGIACAGFGFGALLGPDRKARRVRVASLGLLVTALFFVVRLVNVYGDMRYPPMPGQPAASVAGEPGPWRSYESVVTTALSFLNCQKYPPSLVYALMTLGPMLLAIAVFDRPVLGRPARALAIVGGVPLFFFVVHIPLVHALAIAADYARYGVSPYLHAGPWAGARFAAPGSPLPDYGFGLPVVYVVWVAVLAILYPACRWFHALKRARPGSWASYL